MMNWQLELPRLSHDMSTSIKAAAWLVILTHGDPDILAALVALIERIG